jgi:hypothetical protein
VLFHRRRTKRCAPSAPPPAPTPPRRYQLFTYHAKSQQEVDMIRRGLRSPGNFQPNFQRVDVLEFASGAATMVTPENVLLQDWGGVQPGNSLAYGATATAIPTDAVFGNQRLTRVVQAVSTVSPLDPALGFLEVLPDVPPQMVVPGIDGIVLLITLDAVRTTCQDVYRVAMDTQTRQMLDGNLLDQIIKLKQTTNLGAAEFAEGSNVVTTDDAKALLQAFQKNGGGFPMLVLVYPKPNDSSGGDDATLIARGRSIGDALGGSPNTQVEKRDPQGTWPVGTSCPVITLVVSG